MTTEVTCQFDELPSAASATVDLSFVAGTRGAWPLAAEVSAWEIDPEPTYDSADIVVTAVPHADVSVAMAARDRMVIVPAASWVTWVSHWDLRVVLRWSSAA